MPHGDIRVGIAGLGGAARLVTPYFDRVPGVALAGAADLRPEARAAFTAEFGAPAFDSVAALAAAGDIDAIWIETPNHLHCEHALTAIAAGKHVICAKPIGVTLDECDRMIAAADRAGVRLLQGHSKIFDAPIRAMRELIAGGRLGRAIQIDSWLFNDWLQRPRLAEELDERAGGGLVMRQGPHMFDIACYLAGARARSVRAIAGRWDPHFDCAGNFTALLDFESGAAATISVNGYGYFDGAELTCNIDGIGAIGPDPRARAQRPRRTGPLPPERKYVEAAKPGATPSVKAGDKQPFFGLTIVACERGVIRQSPDGLLVYSEAGCEEVRLPPNPGRAAELIELRDALAQKRAVFPDGRWGKATLEACLAVLESARLGAEIKLRCQVAAP